MLRISLPLMLFFIASSPRLAACGTTLQAPSLSSSSSSFGSQNRLVLSLPWPRPLNTFHSLVSFQPQSCNLLCSFSSGFLLNWREKAMKKSAFEKMVLQKNRSKGSQEDQKRRSNRFLVTVNILGSAGPIRFVVNEKDLVSGVIDTALKSYAREGRLPVLGFDVSNFLLYCANAGFDALNPLEPIGSYGARNFVLCKKQVSPSKAEPQSELISQKSSGGWKAWLNKSFGLKILSH